MYSARWECLGMNSMMKCLTLMKHIYGSHYIDKADLRNTHQASVDTQSAEELLEALWEGRGPDRRTHSPVDSESGCFRSCFPTHCSMSAHQHWWGAGWGAEVEPAVQQDAAGQQHPIMQPALGAQSRTRGSVGRFLNLGVSLYNRGYLSH